MGGSRERIEGAKGLVINLIEATGPVLEKVMTLVPTINGRSKPEGKIIEFPANRRRLRKPDGSGPFSPAA